MAASINVGWSNLRASNYMTGHSNKIAANVTRLSGNTKYASGADNPGGYAYGQKVRSSAVASNQAVENVQDLQTKYKIADSAYASVLDILSKAKDLAAQGESSGNSSGVSDAITALNAQITSIANAATFNGTSVFGSALSAKINESAATATGASLTSPTSSATTVTAIQSQIETILGYQAQAGATEAGLGYLNDFLSSKAAYMSESEANNNNVNITTEMAAYVRNTIALQTAQYIAAQNNSNAYSVLNLLK